MFYAWIAKKDLNSKFHNKSRENLIKIGRLGGNTSNWKGWNIFCKCCSLDPQIVGITANREFMNIFTWKMRKIFSSFKDRYRYTRVY